MKYQKPIIIILVLTLLGYAGYIFYSSGNSQVKTDPAFYEIKAKIIDGFPADFPVYPGAQLIGSSNVNPQGTPDEGYRVKWVIDSGTTSVPVIMRWYETELPTFKWQYTPPDDYESLGEQVAYISSEDRELKGYIAAEIEDEGIEIIVDVRKD